jgi:hypothetical protein
MQSRREACTTPCALEHGQTVIRNRPQQIPCDWRMQIALLYGVFYRFWLV